jgi:hypothetical protein
VLAPAPHPVLSREKVKRTHGGHILSALVLLATLVACGGSKKPPEPVAITRSVSSKCPDLAKADELGAFDFAKEYALSKDAAEKLKAAALAALEVSNLNDKLDAELGIACSQIAHDLGDKGDWRNGNDACAAAIKDVREGRAKLGPKVNAQLVVKQPLCAVDASLMTKCAAICDSSVPAERVKADCQQRAGRCDGQCDGTCEAKASGKCEGTCSGTCDGKMSGTCGGRCKGMCNGKNGNGPCIGTCIGTCERGPMNGECAGSCTGSCKLAKAGICEGTCNGKCSVELASDARCTGEYKTPDVSTDCRARCEIAVINQTECTTPTVGLVLAGGKGETADAMKSAVDKSFPALLKILFEVGDKGTKRVLNAQAVIEGARKGMKDMAASGGKGSAAASEAQLVKCFDEPFKRAEAAAASVKQGIDEAAGVRDEATK